MLVLVFFLGLGISFIAGLLGIGGGIILGPALLYLPSLFSLDYLDMKTVTGLTITQGLSASLSGAVRHGKYKFVCKDLVVCMGISIFFASLMGGIISKYVPNRSLLIIFATLAFIAATLMFLPLKEKEQELAGKEVFFNKPLAVLISIVVGLLGGMTGLGGSFILIPLILYVLKVPTRTTLGSNLAIVSLSSLAGFFGKLAIGQVPFLPALVLVGGSIPGAQAGSYFSKQTKTNILRYLLAIIIALAALRMWLQVLWK